MIDLPRIVTKTEAARRLGICTTTFTEMMAKKGAPRPVHNKLWDFKAIELYFDKLGNIKADSGADLEEKLARRLADGDGENALRH